MVRRQCDRDCSRLAAQGEAPPPPAAARLLLLLAAAARLPAVGLGYAAPHRFQTNLYTKQPEGGARRGGLEQRCAARGGAGSACGCPGRAAADGRLLAPAPAAAVTDLAGRIFSMWTLTSCMLCLICARNPCVPAIYGARGAAAALSPHAGTQRSPPLLPPDLTQQAAALPCASHRPVCPPSYRLPCRRHAGLLPHRAAALQHGAAAVPHHGARHRAAAHDRGGCAAAGEHKPLLGAGRGHAREPAQGVRRRCRVHQPPPPAPPSPLPQASPACGWCWGGTTTPRTLCALSPR